MPRDSEPSPANRRRRLIGAGSLVADELVAHWALPPRGSIDGHKLVVTFAGAFEFQVGRSRTFVDPACLLFAAPGEDYVDHHLVPSTGHSSIILTPSADLRDELWGAMPIVRTGRASLGIHAKVQRLRRSDCPLEREELAIAVVAESHAGRQGQRGASRRCVTLAKAALHDEWRPRRSLSDLAADIGVSAAHLSHSFKQCEGMPLYRYQTELRLARALERLPESPDITALAFDLGFSSHSHFTAAFRARLGMSPSQYRAFASR